MIKQISMNKRNIIICLVTTLVFTGCKKDDFDGMTANHPDIPVTVSNLYGTFNGVPTVSTSLSGGGAIVITLNVPSGAGRTIKEITRVGIANTTSNYKVVQVTSGLYNTAPIVGSGTSVTFSTSIIEFTAKTGIAVTVSGTSTSFLSRYFYFLITLDNGEQIIPVPVRVYVAT
jgi:hypothetical protein